MYHFTPPKKHKKIYILINVLIILLIISITAFFHDRIEIFGIPIALWCLFNGLWSVNANWYSWFHRNDKSSSSHGFWLICLITGLAMSILLLLIHLLMWFVTPFYCSCLHLHTFLLLFRRKKHTLSTKTTCAFFNEIRILRKKSLLRGMKSLRDEIRLRRDRRGGFNFIWGESRRFHPSLRGFHRAKHDFIEKHTRLTPWFIREMAESTWLALLNVI